MAKYIMALDAGTTSNRCILFNEKGEICSVAQKEFTQIYPQPGWVEHNANEIWDTQLHVCRQAMDNIGAKAADIAAIGITNQRETTIVWDKKTGEPVYNAIVWQCRRTADMKEELMNKYPEIADEAYHKTGLVFDPYFSGTKLRWILNNVPGVRARAEAGNLAFGTVDTWLIYKLTKGRVHATDFSNASRTLMFNINTCTWDKKLCEQLEVPMSMLPEAKPSSGLFGESDPEFFGGAIKITGVAGDQQAALFGQCGFGAGEVKSTYGTGGFMLMNTGEDAVLSNQGLLTTIAASAGEKVHYALEGSVFIAGAAIQWLRDEMRMLKSSPQSEEYCRNVPDSNGMYIVPAFSGMGAPYWQQYARGMIVGLTRGVSKDHFIRATVESLAYQTNDLLRVMTDEAGVTLSSLKVDGGASANDFLMQFQADISNVTITRPKCIETTALGAAYLAGLAVGYWKDTAEVSANWQCGRVFIPSIEPAKRKKLLSGWKKAVDCAIYWAKEEEDDDE